MKLKNQSENINYSQSEIIKLIISTEQYQPIIIWSFKNQHIENTHNREMTTNKN